MAPCNLDNNFDVRSYLAHKKEALNIAENKIKIELYHANINDSQY